MLKTKETLLQGPSEDELTCSQKLTKGLFSLICPTSCNCYITKYFGNGKIHLNGSLQKHSNGIYSPEQETAVKIIANNISLFTKVFRFMKAFTQLQCSYTDVTGWNSMASMKIGNVEEYRKPTGRKMKHPFSLHILLKWGMGLRSG